MARNRNRIGAAVAAAALAGGGAGAAVVALTTHASPRVVTTAAPASNVSNVASASLSVAQLAKQWTPSVVEVDSTETAADSPFPGASSGSSAEGTGFVYDANGDILTNEHVIDGASAISVKFEDGSHYKATVVGKDPSTDVAVLHVDAPASKLHPVTLGNSDALQVGDGVVAIGDPFGLDDSVTTGIVSALGREISAPDGTPIENAIQTDAAINHGNSGGPLFDMHGDVVGITAQIQSDSGGNDGVGFAIPSNLVKSIAAQLIASGSVKHALLGVEVATTENGVRVHSVETGSGAARGGVRAGDVITAVDGSAVTSAPALRAIVDEHHPGQTLRLTVRRDGASKTLTVTLGTRPS
jgi:putative serine protease PepD